MPKWKPSKEHFHMSLTGGELCKGCIDFGVCTLRPTTFKGPTCPCINCIVKMVCKNSCQDWLEFEDAYFDVKPYFES